LCGCRFWAPVFDKDIVKENKLVAYSFSYAKVTENDDRRTTAKIYNLKESADKSMIFEPYEIIPDSKFAWILKKKPLV
jgi:hypothetical protein